MTRSPLLPITAAFAAGIGVAQHVYLRASEQLLVLALFILAAAVLLRSGNHLCGLICCWLGFFVCGSFAAAHEHAYLPADHLERLARQGVIRLDKPIELTGWARTPTSKRPGSETFDLEVAGIGQDGRQHATEGAVRVYYYPERKGPPSLNVAYGTRLSVSLNDLRPPRNYSTPGSFDWAAYLRGRGVFFSALVHGPQDMQVLPGRSGRFWLSAVYGLRTRLLDHLDRMYSAGGTLSDQGAVLKAMLLGDENWLGGQTRTAFENSGTYHFLVVSGWSVGALALPLLWLVSRLRWPQWLGTLLVGGAVAGFALLAEGGSSVGRAALMFLLYLLARLFYRPRALLNSVAAAALILLAAHPYYLWDTGFQLTFVAVLVLAAIAIPLVEWTVAPYRRALQAIDDPQRGQPAEEQKTLLLEPRHLQFRQDFRVLLDWISPSSETAPARRRWLRAGCAVTAAAWFWLAEAALFTLAVQTGSALLMAAYFHRVTWSGLGANLLILPLASAVVLGGMAVLLLSLVWWRASAWAGALLGRLVKMLEAIAAWAAHFPRWNVRVPTPPPAIWLCFFVLLITTAVLASRRSRWIAAAGMAVFALCLVLTLAPYTPQLPPDRLELTVLDVGQGDSLLVSFPRGQTMLIDAGGEIPVAGSPPSRFDIGEEVVSSYLWSRDIRTLNYVVLTHDHEDHYGGMSSVLANFEVEEFWIGPDPGDRDMSWLRERAARAGGRIVRPREGDHRTIDGVEVEVLSPPPGWAPRRVGNDDSIVLRLGYGARHFLLPGDVEARMERHVLGEGTALRSEVLKVAHHGSKTSSTPAFLERVAAGFGIISDGAYNRYGHPNQETLDALRAARIRTYRTDQDGAVTASTDGNRIEVSTFRDSLVPWPRFAP